MGLPHSFCRAAYSWDGGGVRADEAEIWDAPDAVEVVVLERERAALVSSADGGGTDSRMTWDLAKAS